MDAPTSAAAVANYFLDLQDADSGPFPPIDPMKLQKLLFYSHGWWLAFKDGPLFEEDVYAWPWGPVIPAIYAEFRDFGRRPIAGKRATDLVRTGPGALDFQIKVPSPPSEDVQELLRGVWDSHKQLTGVQLSNATHAPGEAWTLVKERYGDLSSKPLIPNALIRDTFKAKLAQAR
jgi:uncharacterized phage-associated protein